MSTTKESNSNWQSRKRVWCVSGKRDGEWIHTKQIPKLIFRLELVGCDSFPYQPKSQFRSFVISINLEAYCLRTVIRSVFMKLKMLKIRRREENTD